MASIAALNLDRQFIHHPTRRRELEPFTTVVRSVERGTRGCSPFDGLRSHRRSSHSKSSIQNGGVWTVARSSERRFWPLAYSQFSRACSSRRNILLKKQNRASHRRVFPCCTRGPNRYCGWTSRAARVGGTSGREPCWKAVSRFPSTSANTLWRPPTARFGSL